MGLQARCAGRWRWRCALTLTLTLALVLSLALTLTLTPNQEEAPLTPEEKLELEDLFYTRNFSDRHHPYRG